MTYQELQMLEGVHLGKDVKEYVQECVERDLPVHNLHECLELWRRDIRVLQDMIQLHSKGRLCASCEAELAHHLLVITANIHAEMSLANAPF